MKKLVYWGLKKNIRGFGFIVRSLFTNQKIIVKSKYGIRIYADPYEKIDNAVIRYGYFDDDVYKAISKNLKDNDTFWDIGANIGLHSVTLKKNYPNLNCYAFEPFPRAAVQFELNCTLNNITIPLYTIAIGKVNGFKGMYTTNQNLGASGLLELKTLKGEGTLYKVAVYSSDQLVSDFNIAPPDILKIDTEGNELNILQGAQGILSSGKCRCIVFEGNRAIKPIIKFLNSYSYKVEKLGETPNYLAKII